MTIKRKLSLLTALVWAGGCGPRPAAPPVRSDPALQVVLQSPLHPIRQLDPTPLRVLVRDQQNQPVSDAKISIDLTMPDMDMGKNRVVPTYQGLGVYTGTGRFTMAGEWRATVTVWRGAHHSARSFPVQVK